VKVRTKAATTEYMATIAPSAAGPTEDDCPCGGTAAPLRTMSEPMYEVATRTPASDSSTVAVERGLFRWVASRVGPAAGCV